uniref:Uncharacterized protein n=1 Tax=Guillardia theta TaxID=55529 RepID=A0A7S4PRH6_GUITH|mmetsp:Transcript_9477/g.31668  ORF Transcript_9477/g.31668 Transcript_9477/m.31668 type:complete len:177 (+) Transcript_9477:162-692(+)
MLRLINSYGSQTPSSREDKKGRVILASGLVAFALIVLALVAAASANGFSKPAQPSIALQMLAIRQLQLSILKQSPETVEKIRKMLDSSEFGSFDLDDKMVAKPSSNGGVSSQTSLNLVAAKARPLQGGVHSIDLALIDKKVPLTSAPAAMQRPRANLLVDTMGDKLVETATAPSSR